jgi:hypothetical protein
MIELIALRNVGVDYAIYAIVLLFRPRSLNIFFRNLVYTFSIDFVQAQSTRGGGGGGGGRPKNIFGLILAKLKVFSGQT